MIPKGITDKYEVISTLHKNTATTVLLVRHRQIGDTRVLKAIQASQPGATKILSEANLLAGLNSPGIPTIFDVGQTEDFYYLVEEYVKGQSLLEYLLENESITSEKLISVMIEVCKIIDVLHTSFDEPVLYRDMKPEHIIIQSNAIRLIDFGIAAKKSECESLAEATVGFAAPEQLNGSRLDERCDVYGIGKVIEYAIPFIKSKNVYKLKYICSKATQTNPNERYENVLELENELHKLQGTKSYETKQKTSHLNKRIAVIGADKSIGCTHIAINLCSYMNKEGINCYYTTLNKEFTVRRLYENLNETKLREGVLYHKTFKGLMENGPCFEGFTPPDENAIIDIGFAKEKDMKADLVLYVIGFNPWQNKNNYPEWIKDDNVVVISNNSTKLQSLMVAKELKKKVYIFPRASVPFKLSKKEMHSFNAILKEKWI